MSVRSVCGWASLVLVGALAGCAVDDVRAESAAVTATGCGDQLVPVLTGPSAAVTASGLYGGGYEAWRAFDGSTSSMWISGVFQTPAWIAHEWADGPRTVTSYAIHFVNGTLTSRAPRDWTFQGWDGARWVVLDRRTRQTGWLGNERREFTVAAPGAYAKYRLHVTDDNDARAGVVVISMGRLELLGCGCTDTSQVPVLTGPDSGVIRSGVYSSSYEAWQAFDGNRSSMWISGVYETPAWIGYQWADGARTITRYAIDFINGSLTSRAPRDWTFEGWDGADWVVLDARSMETGWAGSERREYDVAVPGPYTAYRLHVTDDNDARAGVVVVSMGTLELIGNRCE